MLGCLIEDLDDCPRRENEGMCKRGNVCILGDGNLFVLAYQR